MHAPSRLPYCRRARYAGAGLPRRGWTSASRCRMGRGPPGRRRQASCPARRCPAVGRRPRDTAVGRAPDGPAGCPRMGRGVAQRADAPPRLGRRRRCGIPRKFAMYSQKSWMQWDWHGRMRLTYWRVSEGEHLRWCGRGLPRQPPLFFTLAVTARQPQTRGSTPPLLWRRGRLHSTSRTGWLSRALPRHVVRVPRATIPPGSSPSSRHLALRRSARFLAGHALR